MQGLLIAGRYRLADSIGSGGMGRVWRAHDEVLHRMVAVKELTAALYATGSDQTVLLARTRAEARAAARINHSAVVTVHDVLEHDGRPWIVMELVEGGSLADLVKERGRVEPAEAARIGLWVLRALRAAHTAGVLHRDVKPGNVLLGADRRVLLTDFGIAQIEGDSTITRTGEVVGSVDYLAPERVRGHDPGPASDLWALGATLYTAVEGRSPFRRTSPLSTMQAIVEEDTGEPQHAGPLGPVIAALLRKDPARRPGTDEAEQMLAEAAEGRRPRTAQAFVPAQGGGAPAHGPEHRGQGHPGQGHPGQGYSTHDHPGQGHAGQGHLGHGPAGYPTGAALPAAAAPVPLVTAVAPVPPGGSLPPRPRRRLRVLALVVALAAVLGAGAAVAVREWNGLEQTDGTGRTTSQDVTSPSANGSATPGFDGTVPASWHRYDDEWGFSLYLPKGWSRQVVGVPGALRQVDYTPDGGEHFVRISIDTSPDFKDAYAHQLDLDEQLARRLADYRRVRLEKNVYRDLGGSVWECAWTARPKDTRFPGPRHAEEQTYISRDGTEYVIYISSPAADWARTDKQFRAVLQGWQQPR
ncbi:serine/threonine-protein kinase [Streptomyces sp. NPDC017086]|uniref:serine/threonine-protein kinase n=1 Tax=Streptomyces sp. NPDC017086 TaxID=3364976 RepID=UPI0037B46705